MPKMYVISPKALGPRRNRCREHLQSVGVEAEFMFGLYGPDMKLGSQYNNPKRPHARYLRLISANICLALNHWALWNHIAMSEGMEAIIFEDDVLLPPDFLQRFTEVRPELPDDWDFFYLSILYPKRVQQGKLKVNRVTPNIVRFKKVLAWDGTCDGLHAYMLNTRGARKMLEQPFKLDEPVDRWVSLNLLQFLNAYIWMPSPVTQRTLGSVPDGVNWHSTSGGIKEDIL